MQISPYLRNAEGQRLIFWCPGCQDTHMIKYGENGWSWDGNKEDPTFNPSILVQGVKITELGEQQYRDWLDKKIPIPNGKLDSVPMRCHSFVRAGYIQFLNDCTHALAGQTVRMPVLPEHLQD